MFLGSIDSRWHCTEDSPVEMWLSIILLDLILSGICIYTFIKPIYVAARSIESCTSTHQSLTKNLAKRVISWYVEKEIDFLTFLSLVLGV